MKRRPRPFRPTSQLSRLGTTEPAPARNQGLLHLVWEAVRGSHVDFTKESLGRSVLLLAIPMVIEMFAESLFAVVDMFWVGKLGPDCAGHGHAHRELAGSDLRPVHRA